MKLNGWHRLWILWAVFAVPGALFVTNQTFPATAAPKLWDEEMALLRHSSEKAVERLTAALERELGPTSDAQEIGRRGSIVMMRLMNKQDKQHVEEAAAIKSKYEPLAAAAVRADQRLLWQTAAILWVVLVGVAYGVGATVAWVRRGWQ